MMGEMTEIGARQLQTPRWLQTEMTNFTATDQAALTAGLRYKRLHTWTKSK